ncbi:hypothetical protein [Rhizobium ruizarguesonis]|uniref:hypothetical protein n=1 Tax=Rhizobium ruizarguesonis TaxID=2081791 RepID=UPI00103116A9|nr:hypothetical protein [Rhizobium ruizarguesonis]TAT71069.1 hypothetical protein ELI52_36505 [Rhizobium ruizarguesonis]
MTSVARLFNNEVQSGLNYSGVWLPNKRLIAGDVCSARDGQLQRTSNLHNLGLSVDVDDLQGASEIYYETPGAFDISVSGSAGADASAVGAKADGRADLRFKSDFAVVMRLENTRGSAVSDLKALERQLLERFRQGTWDLDDYFVVETLSARHSVILVSNNKNASASLGLDLTASKALPVDVRGSLALTTSISNVKGAAFHSVSKEEITPLVRLARLVDPWFGKPRVTMKSSGSKSSPMLVTGVDYTADMTS